MTASHTNIVSNEPPIKSYLIDRGSEAFTLVIEPLIPGFGQTIGNALRRILLSSIPGTAVTRIKINDITHEYQAIGGVVEDALDIVLNLKNLHVKILNGEEKITLSLKVKKQGPVTAADFEIDSRKVEIMNPELHICTLDKESEVKIEVEVSRGLNYLPVEKIDLASNINPQNILVDALFSPVTNVSLTVEDTRVGDITNYDKLSINFNTNGTITGEEAVEFAMNLIIDLFQKAKNSFGSMPSEINTEVAAVIMPEISTIIDLPKKILSILSKNQINTITELQSRSEDLDQLAGIDEKMIKSIHTYLSTL